MKNDRPWRVLRLAAALATLAALLVLIGLAITGPAHAATRSPVPEPTRSAKVEQKTKKTASLTAATATPAPGTGAVQQRGAEVRAGEDIVVPKGVTVPSVAAFGGDITINGRVTDAVVAFGGDVVVKGRVGSSVVAFGGDITVDGYVGATVVAFRGDIKLGPTAVVGNDMGPRDASVVVMGGDLTRAPGAQVHGLVRRSAGSVDLGAIAGSAGRWVILGRWLGGVSFFGWLFQTAFCLVLALVATALMPTQLRRVQDQLRQRPWASLGWGVLAFFLAVPFTFLLLGITVIGLLLWLPLLVFVLLTYFFGITAVAAVVAQKAIRGFGGKENLMLAVAVGVVGTTIVSRIPVAGVVILFVMTWLGAGAVVMAVDQRRRERREAAAARAAASALAAAAPGGAQYPGSAPVGAPVAVITPIVQTSPEQQGAAQLRAAAPIPASAPPPPAPLQPSVTASGPGSPEPPATPQAPAAPATPATPETPAAPDTEHPRGGDQPQTPET